MRWDEKRVLLPYRITEPEQLERYFEKMAVEGWYPVSVGEYSAKFRKGKPRELRFCIDFTDVGKDEAELRRYTTLCGDAGWRFRLRADNGWLLFTSRDVQAEPLQTDSLLAVKNFKKAFWKQFWGNAGFSVVLLFWSFLDLGLNRSDKTRLLSGWDTMLEFYCLYFFLLLVCFLLVNAALNLRGYFVARSTMRKGMPWPDISEKTIRRRLFRRKFLLWAAGLPLAFSVAYDIWAGNFRPAAEQWIAMTLGIAVIIAGFFLKKQWLDRLARKAAWIIGGIFFALGLVLSYPLYRMEPAAFAENAPIIQVSDFLPVTEIHTTKREYGHTPFYERWEVWESGSVPVSENVYDGMTIFYTAYRAANPEIAKRLLAEEDATNNVIHQNGLPRTDLDWGIEEAYQLGDLYLMLRDGNGVLVYALWGDPDVERCREILLEQLDKIRE